jgi:hypothetical protein
LIVHPLCLWIHPLMISVVIDSRWAFLLKTASTSRDVHGRHVHAHSSLFEELIH